ncbi:inorganic pyrophosphatase [Tieghemostelium lacteum]|uniref:inorganic diphosphatase n=1 Tax=Tieghemostelium lacteum TaxID=361077 RepID=A0A152A5P2_TIELA|nr:inorganic pyrophosphatase [Tieghemostelium lacteum]|eukprot:KYR01546.1 inorganic pyrophosphatase [Tieghemostelium lacteum]
MSHTAISKGEKGTLEYRVFLAKDSNVISPFHDVPLWQDEKGLVANMLVEIPKGTNAKLEIATKEFMNPIKQDVKDGKLRFIHDKYPFNYGALPQTWESPSTVHPETKCKGDNDPIDACEIGSVVGSTGEVKQVKVIGVWAMIDAGETDWKILCIDVNDPVASQINSIDDVEKVLPGKIQEVFTFLRDYKIPDGKGPNQFAYDSKLLGSSFAVQVIQETHHDWKTIFTTENPLSAHNVTQTSTKACITKDDVKAKLGF